MPFVKISSFTEFPCLVKNMPPEIYLLIKLEFPSSEEVSKRPPVHLALVLDRSGSMSGQKLEMTKQSAIYFMNWLTRYDFLSVVTYDDDVDVVVPHVSLTDKPSISERIKSIQSGGSTNLSGGMMRGFAEIRDNQQEGHHHREILLTDGLANVGVTDHSKLVEIASKNLQKGVALTTLGFGDDFDETLLKALADAGGGRFHYVKEPEGLAKAFQAEFGELVAMVAQNLEVKIAPEKDGSFPEVITDYPQTKHCDGIQVRIGDVRAGDVKQIILRVHLVSLSALEDNEMALAHIQVRCDPTIGDMEPENQSHTITLPRSQNPDESPVANPDVQREAWMANAAKLKLDVAKNLEKGNIRQAVADVQKYVQHKSTIDLINQPLSQCVRNETMKMEKLLKSIQDGEDKSNLSKNLVQDAYNQRSNRGAYQQFAGVEKIGMEISARRPEEAEDAVSAIQQKAKNAGFDDEILGKIAWILRELIDNAIHHGYKDNPDGVVRVESYVSPNYVRMIVADDGPGFDYPGTIAAAEKKKTEHNLRGRGLILIKSLADRIDFQTRNGTKAEVVVNRNTLSMNPESVVSRPTGSMPTSSSETSSFGMTLDGKTGIVVLKMDGSVDGSTIRRFEDRMNDVFDKGYCKIILDMGKVSYVNSTGLGILVKYADKAQGLGGNIVLLHAEKLKPLLEMLGIFVIFPPLCSTIESAMEFFR